jgi:hypothetical protein
MKRLIWLVVLPSLTGCSNPSTVASPSPSVMSGNYALSIGTAATCNMSPSVFNWNVVASYSLPSGYSAVTVILPAPQPTLYMMFTYNQNSLTPTTLAGALYTPIANLANGPGVPVPNTDLRFNTTATLLGDVTAATDGRGEVTAGGLTGDIQLIDKNNKIVQDCYGINMPWTLLPR